MASTPGSKEDGRCTPSQAKAVSKLERDAGRDRPRQSTHEPAALEDAKVATDRAEGRHETNTISTTNSCVPMVFDRSSARSVPGFHASCDGRPGDFLLCVSAPAPTENASSTAPSSPTTTHRTVQNVALRYVRAQVTFIAFFWACMPYFQRNHERYR